MTKLKGPKFVQYFQPVIDALRDLGSSAKPREVYAWIAERHGVPQEEIEGTTKGGQSKFENKVGWARFYLAKAGLIDTEQRGVWVLTEKGRRANLSHDEAYSLFRTIHDGFQRDEGEPGETVTEKAVDEADTSAPNEKAYLNQDAIQEELVRILRDITDKGFEELCARLLRHIGFENLRVCHAGSQGKTGDRRRNRSRNPGNRRCPCRSSRGYCH